jgi:Fur family ferric uptake transcriptional regulator
MNHDPTAVLKQHGFQVTPQRLAILRVVADNPHITADRIAELVKVEIGAISRQSVYNTVGALVDKGLLRRIQPIGSPALYEDRVGDNHHHLICRDCGRVDDVDCAVGAAPCLTPSDGRGYAIDEAEVVYRGLCPDCLARAGSGSPSAHHDDDPDDVRKG